MFQNTIKDCKRQFGSILAIAFLALAIGSCERNELDPVTQIKPDNSCDTAKVSYAGFIEPFVQYRCESCHNNSKPYGGVNLQGYENTKKYALNGEFLKSYHGSMKAYFGDDLCDYLKIEAWIKNSAPNN